MNALLDVTEQTAKAQALRESEERFRIVAQVSNDGLWDWDLTTNRVWRNNGIQLYGQTPYDPTHPWAARIHPDDLHQGREAFAHALDTRQPGWTSEYRVQRPDGSWATVLQRGFILYDGDRPVRALGATIDITAPLQLAEAEAQAVLAERERLARDLHDSVTQSLYSVSLLAEAARRHALEEQEAAAAEFIGRLGSLTQQALRQMRLLVYELRPAVLDTEGLVGALRHRLDAVEKRAGIKVNLIIRGERAIPASLQGEMYRIAHEALNNALTHAVATAITVRLDTLGNAITLEISDNGRGFDSNALAFGRGLPTMRERSSRLGGELTIDSTPGRGTLVRLTLPLAAA
jgi:PAS domain S-box-containing protein